MAPANHKRHAFAPLDWQGDLFGEGKPPAIISGHAIGRSCRCGGASYLTGKGSGPHVASLTCVSCGAKSWLSHDDAAKLGRAVA